MSAVRFLLPVLFVASAAAEVCAPTDLYGAYGVQPSGIATISGGPAPVAVISRLVFGDERKITGYSSVNFNGYFLGNPVTGTYEINPDCSFTYKLQDTSGAFQNFGGTVRPGAGEAQVRQTDPGAGAKGVLKRVASACQNSMLHGRFLMSTVGISTPFAGLAAPPSVLYTAIVEADGNGNLKLARGPEETTGTYKVDADCFVTIEYAATGNIRLRGIIVSDGQEILAIETDPAQVAAVKFTAQRLDTNGAR